MATDAISNIKNAYTTDTGSKRLNEVQNLPQISLEAEYTRESDYQVDVGETKDATTESRVETDDVNVTAEIYSMTDLSSQLQQEELGKELGSYNPEFHDGKCVILCAYRCKGVDTTDLSDVPESGHALDVSSAMEHEEPLESVECGQYPCMQNNVITITIDDFMCKDSCPNLIATEGSQTDEKICGRPDDQGDFAGVTTLAVSMKKGDEELKTSSQASLPTIEELEETPEKDESLKIVEIPKGEEAKVSKRTKDSEVGTCRTEEVAAGPSDVFSVCTTVDTCSRKPIRSIYDAGTIISTPSSTWVHRPRRQRDCRVICTRASGSSCSDWRLNDRVVCCSRTVRPITSHCTVQCEIIRNADRPNPCDLYERYASRWSDRRNRCYPTVSSSWIEPNEFCSTTDYSTCKSRRSFGSFRESFMRHQPCGINNTYGCSIAGGPLENGAQNCSNRNNACNPYYLNFHKTYNSIGRYYPCNNGYNAWKANYCAIGNRTIHCAPSRCCYFINSWC